MNFQPLYAAKCHFFRTHRVRSRPLWRHQYDTAAASQQKRAPHGPMVENALRRAHRSRWQCVGRQNRRLPKYTLSGSANRQDHHWRDRSPTRLKYYALLAKRGFLQHRLPTYSEFYRAVAGSLEMFGPAPVSQNRPLNLPQLRRVHFAPDPR